MKYTGTFIACALLLASSCALPAMPSRQQQNSRKLIKLEMIRPTVDISRVGADMCPFCVQFMGDAINELLNLILQGGIVGGCGGLCGKLAQKTGSKALGVACDLICDIVGIEEFMKLIQKADLDPIYFCELAGKMCPIKDDGDAKFTSLAVTPQSGPQGKKDITFQYQSVNGTGTGEISIEIETVDKIPLGESFLHEMAPAGMYNGDFKLDAEPDPNCDPTQGPCEQWLPGTYTVKLVLCNGECGSKHPHSKIYDEITATFTLTA